MNQIPQDRISCDGCPCCQITNGYTEEYRGAGKYRGYTRYNCLLYDQVVFGARLKQCFKNRPRIVEEE